jgi:hypothetical protein
VEVEAAEAVPASQGGDLEEGGEPHHLGAVARAVPPVAMTSSTTRTRSPGPMASRCISKVAEPYSSTYDSDTVDAGSLPILRTGTSAVPRAYATGLPRMKPRASMAATLSTRPA